jgi:hypothetical protein
MPLNKFILIFFCGLSFFQARSQPNERKYWAFINYATWPGILGFNGRLFKFSSDTLSVMNLVERKSFGDSTAKDIYDTSYYLLSKKERQSIIETIQSIDSLTSVFNFCIIDGLRFYFSCSLDTTKHTAWVSNAYNSRIYFFVDIINKYVPVQQSIHYNKRKLIKEEKKCLKEMFRTGE